MTMLSDDQIKKAHTAVFNAIQESQKEGFPLSKIFELINNTLNLRGTDNAIQKWEDIQPSGKRGRILAGTKSFQPADGEIRYYLHAFHPLGRGTYKKREKLETSGQKPERRRKTKATASPTADSGFYFELTEVSFETLDLPISHATAARMIIASREPEKPPKRIGRGFVSNNINFIELKAQSVKGNFGEIQIEAKEIRWSGKVAWVLVEF